MDDLISRSKAIRWVKAECNPYGQPTLDYESGIKVIEHLERMPSAQPEIIRCKDCKWWDKSEDSPFGYCMAMKHGYMSANWEIGIYRRYKGDFYCADAERRTDDKTNKGASC